MERRRTTQPYLYLIRDERAPAAQAEKPLGAGIEKALELMRGSPDQRWTVASLARRAGMSRAVFARHFHAALGSSPLRFLSALRMERARELLDQTDLSLAAVAERVGYVSQYAFNRAFKRHFLVPPGSYRRGAQAGTVRMAA